MTVRTSTIVNTTAPASVTVHVWDDGGPTVNAAVVDVVMEIEPRITQFVANASHLPNTFAPTPPLSFITWHGLNIPTNYLPGVDCIAFIERKQNVDAPSTTLQCIVSGTLTGGAPYYKSIEVVVTWP